MSKFFVLLKKEVREFITPQHLVPLLLTVVLFMLLGNVIGTEREKSDKEDETGKPGLARPVAVLDQDNTPTSKQLLERTFGEPGRNHMYHGSEASVVRQAKEKGERVLLVIPKDFGDGLQAGKPQKLTTYTYLKGISMLGIKDTFLVGASIGALNESMSRQLMAQFAPGMDVQFLKQSISSKEVVVVDDRQSPIEAGKVMGVLGGQLVFIPIILFMVIIFASQMIATAMATEQENKTLETLLSAPVNRRMLVIAKLIGAGTVALMFSLVYMVGFRFYIKGMTGSGPSLMTDSATAASMKALGLVFDPAGYALLGISLFLGILCALAISLILGSLAQGVSNVQAVTAPIIGLVMIPYIFTLFLDFTKLTPWVKYMVYAIPFSHPFLAAQNILFHRYLPVVYGIGYELLVFFVFVYIAGKLFSTDRILTMKINWGKKQPSHARA